MHALSNANVISTMYKDLGALVRGSNNIYVSALSASVNGAFACYTIYNLSDMSGNNFFSMSNMLGAKVLCAGVVAVTSMYISRSYEQASQNVSKP